MFSRPVSSRLNPTPSDSNGVTRPHTATRPAVGGRMPAIVRSSVVLPAPLRPMTPYTAPAGTWKLTPRSASISIARFERSRSPAMVPFNVWFFSRVTRKLTQTSSTQTAGERSEADGKVSLARQEPDGSEEEETERPRTAGEEIGRRRPPSVEDLLERCVERIERVPTEEREHPFRDLAHEIQHRRDVQPDARRVREEPAGVAVEDHDRRQEQSE